jgi:hypothetical protein
MECGIEDGQLVCLAEVRAKKLFPVHKYGTNFLKLLTIKQKKYPLLGLLYCQVTLVSQ